jgi:hypothetical protein
VDPYIDMAESATGIYEHCCDPERKHPGLNSTACAAIESGYDICTQAGEKCRSTYDLDLCVHANTVCDDLITKWLEDGPEGHPTHNPFDDRIPCDEPLGGDLVMCGGLGEFYK